MGTQGGSEAAAAESFYPSDEDREKWMANAFDMVGEHKHGERHISQMIVWSLERFCHVITRGKTCV